MSGSSSETPARHRCRYLRDRICQALCDEVSPDWLVADEVLDLARQWVTAEDEAEDEAAELYAARGVA